MTFTPQISHPTLPSFKVQMDAEMDLDKPDNILQLTYVQPPVLTIISAFSPICMRAFLRK